MKTKLTLLCKARELINNRKEDYVCIAIKQAAEDMGVVPYYSSTPRHRAVAYLINWIDDQLGDEGVAECWLINSHNLHLSSKDMRQWRIQWIDRMIAELKKP